MPARHPVWPGASSSAAGASSTVVYYNNAPYTGDELSESEAMVGAHKDCVITSLQPKRLEEARVRGWGSRSLDLGHVPTIHGGALYQLRALLFARTQLIALSVPALPEARQVYSGVNIPTLEHLTIRCRYAEPLDVFGCLMAFAENPAHAGVRTLTLSDATHLPTSLGRLRRNAELRMFLAQLTSLELSGRDVADVREAGAQRHLLRFLAAMTGLRTVKYEGYVPGIPAFQVLRVLQYVRRTGVAPLEQLAIAQRSHEGSTSREDAHLYRSITELPMNQGIPVLLDLTLAVGLDKPEVLGLAQTQRFRLRSLSITITPDAIHDLVTVTSAHSSTLRDLRITVLPAPIDEAVGLWQSYTAAVRAAPELHTVHFTPMLPTAAPHTVATELLAAVPGAVELVIHAPNAAAPREAGDAYVALLDAAERAASLQKLHATLCDGGVEARVHAARDRAQRHVHDIELGRRVPGDDVYKAVKMVVPPMAGRLWPVVFLLRPLVANSVIISVIAAILIAITVGGLAIAIAIVNHFQNAGDATQAGPGGAA